MNSITQPFTKLGATFLHTEEEMRKLLSEIHVFIFDWDGVFNDGIKGSDKRSGFSEADSMGLNMLRFNHWRMHQQLPMVFIITGENNQSAIEFAQREHLNAIYLQYRNKVTALDHIRDKFHTKANVMAFVFDDILDVSICRLCKMSFAVRRNASPLFTQYLTDNNVCSYISAFEGGSHAVREISELLIGLSGEYNTTIDHRIDSSDVYQEYLRQRNLVETRIEIALSLPIS